MEALGRSTGRLREGARRRGRADQANSPGRRWRGRTRSLCCGNYSASVSFVRANAIMARTSPNLSALKEDFAAVCLVQHVLWKRK